MEINKESYIFWTILEQELKTKLNAYVKNALTKVEMIYLNEKIKVY